MHFRKRSVYGGVWQTRPKGGEFMNKSDLEKWIAARIGKEIGVEEGRVDTRSPLWCYLMNGFQSSWMIADLEKQLGRRLPENALYQGRTIEDLAGKLLSLG